MRPSEVLRQAERYLDRHGVESPERTAEILLSHVLGTDRAGLYTRDQGLSAAEARAFGRALCRRCGGTPVQYITGRQSFRALDLEVRSGVFIPRPETEVLVEAALESLIGVERPVVVDVGTGTGAIALSIKRERPDAAVHATDLSLEAAELSLENARRQGLEIEAYVGDLLSPLPGKIRGTVALVVSNPPYVETREFEDLPPEVRAEPELALVGGTEFHRRLAAEATAWLAPGGYLVMEIGAEQGPAVAELLQDRFGHVRVLPDLAGRDRVVAGRLTADAGT